jgi:hypothetical protein
MKWLDELVLKRANTLIQRRINTDQAEKTKQNYEMTRSTALSINGGQFAQAGVKIASGLGLNRADFNRDKSMNFTLHPAIGGFILELSHYDASTDRYSQRLHIINDSDDMGDAISKILTLELLRK